MFSVTVQPLLAVPMVWLPKFTLVGENTTTGVAAMPIPVRLTVSGVLPPIEATSCPVLAPGRPGANDTITLQVECAARVVPQVLVCTNAVDPEIERGEDSVASVPLVLFSVTVQLLLVVPTAWLPKSMLVGENTTNGTFDVPTPIRLMLCDPPAALSVNVRYPARVPVVVGVKATCSVQVEYADSVDPQLPVKPKSTVSVKATDEIASGDPLVLLRDTVHGELAVPCI